MGRGHGRPPAHLREASDRVTWVAYSADGARVLSGSHDSTVKLWDAATGRLMCTFEGNSNGVTSIAFPPDGALVLFGDGDGNLKMCDAATGRVVRAFEEHSDSVLSVAFSRDGARMLSGDYGGRVKLWDVITGQLVHTFEGHLDVVWSVAFSPDGHRILSSSADTTVRIWDAATGDLQSTLIGGRTEEWLAITPAGFFGASRKGVDHTLSIVRGFDVAAIGQVHQSLFNPDLVRESLAGDPDGEVREAAKVINHEKVLDSGPAPIVAITSHTQAGQSSSDLVTLLARVTDRGKGIGRIEWRVNGIAAAVAAKRAGAGPDYPLTQQLALDLATTPSRWLPITRAISWSRCQQAQRSNSLVLQIPCSRRCIC